ncbi:endonuclease/exonuclease/phosphatase family protein [Roseivirga sp.]|uniref:endonuclease/exonuclease/phosphatase family protein n=1 Tax=Roseivirga sp. TaxID=1964215 RepID=UPI003B51DD96
MRSLLKLPVTIWAIFSLLVYSSVLISPLFFRFSGVISFGVPIVILLNIILLLLAVFFKWKSGFVAFVLIVIAYPFLNVAMSFQGRTEPGQNSFKVLNYNVMRYNYPESEEARRELSEWIVASDADIICLQEFAFGSKYTRSLNGTKDYYAHFGGYAKSFAIFSKFPIIGSGQIFQDDHTNNVTYADLKIGNDTLRVYNIHLQSMGINPDKIQSTEGIKNEYEEVTQKFLTASKERTRQVKKLMEVTDTIGYRQLLVGDFNDVPFSYNYFQFKKQFKNAFEEVGRGFGITYNGKIPFLRIDNQFYSEGLVAHSLETLNNVSFSDHFPLIGIYEITP